MTFAELTVTVGYNESTRNLNFTAGCVDAEDFKRCIKLIDKYNEFDARVICDAFDLIFGGNGYDKTLHIVIGREGSPVFYFNYFGANQDHFAELCEKFGKEIGADEVMPEPMGYRFWFD